MLKERIIAKIAAFFEKVMEFFRHCRCLLCKTALRIFPLLSLKCCCCKESKEQCRKARSLRPLCDCVKVNEYVKGGKELALDINGAG